MERTERVESRGSRVTRTLGVRRRDPPRIVRIFIKVRDFFDELANPPRADTGDRFALLVEKAHRGIALDETCEMKDFCESSSCLEEGDFEGISSKFAGFG